MADQKDKAAASDQPKVGPAAQGDDETARNLNENRAAREAADQKTGAQEGRVPLPDQQAIIGHQTETLAGAPPFGVVQAGGEGAHADLVEGDPHAFASVPGREGIEAVGAGHPVLEEALDAMQARAAAGIPETPKVGPVPNTTLLDTPGGYQVVPAGMTPQQVAETNAAPRPRQGVLPRSPVGEETGADQRIVAGPGAE